MNCLIRCDGCEDLVQFSQRRVVDGEEQYRCYQCAVLNRPVTT